MITSSEYFLDTNILVYITLKDFDEEKYSRCQEILEELYEKDFTINISPQILREFYAVVTAKNYLKNPLTPAFAKNQILHFMSIFNVIDFNEGALSKLISLVEKYDIRGKNIHDAAIVATMLYNGITKIITYNKKDFQFDEIEIIYPGIRPKEK